MFSTTLFVFFICFATGYRFPSLPWDLNNDIAAHQDHFGRCQCLTNGWSGSRFWLDLQFLKSLRIKALILYFLFTLIQLFTESIYNLYHMTFFTWLKIVYFYILVYYILWRAPISICFPFFMNRANTWCKQPNYIKYT